jgi:hypothetical protein
LSFLLIILIKQCKITRKVIESLQDMIRKPMITQKLKMWQWIYKWATRPGGHVLIFVNLAGGFKDKLWYNILSKTRYESWVLYRNWGMTVWVFVWISCRNWLPSKEPCLLS